MKTVGKIIKILLGKLKRPGRGIDHATPSSAEVKERVELYLFSPSGPSWPVLGWALPFTFTTGKTQPFYTNTEINSEAGQITDTKEIANACNSFFIQIAENLRNKHIVYKAPKLIKQAYSDKTTEMKITPVTDTVVINTIKFLKTGDSSRYDEILKCANVISKPFTFVCKSWSESGIYPEMLKFAIYICLYIWKGIKLKWQITDQFHS